MYVTSVCKRCATSYHVCSAAALGGYSFLGEAKDEPTKIDRDEERSSRQTHGTSRQVAGILILINARAVSPIKPLALLVQRRDRRPYTSLQPGNDTLLLYCSNRSAADILFEISASSTVLSDRTVALVPRQERVRWNKTVAKGLFCLHERAAKLRRRRFGLASDGV